MSYLLLTDVVDPRLVKRLESRAPVRVFQGDGPPRPAAPTDRVLLLHGDEERVSAWLRDLRKAPATALCPVLAAQSADPARAAEDARFADGLWPLGGSEAALERLLDRLDAVAAAVGALAPVDPGLAGLALRQVVLLRYLVTRGIDILEPVPHPTATRGYNLPLGGLILGVPRGEEFAVCDELAALGLFETAFRDRVHLCPHCGRFTLNFREVCPTCRSPRLQVVPNVHHYRCGHVAPEPEFRDGEDLVCPKCRRVLRHVGVDFDRPNEVARCLACGSSTPEPEVECLCLGCGRVFPPEAARRFDVAAYRLTARGAAAAEAGRLPARSLPELLEEQFHTVPAPAFDAMLRLARRLAARYGRPYTLAEVEVSAREKLLESVGPMETLRLLRTLVEILRGTLRDTDVVYPSSENRFRVLLFETPGEGARTALGRVVGEAAERLSGADLGLDVRWVEEGP